MASFQLQGPSQIHKKEKDEMMKLTREWMKAISTSVMKQERLGEIQQEIRKLLQKE